MRISCGSKTGICRPSADAGSITEQAETLHTRARNGILQNNAREPSSIYLAVGALRNRISVVLLRRWAISMTHFCQRQLVKGEEGQTLVFHWHLESPLQYRSPLNSITASSRVSSPERTQQGDCVDLC